MIGQSQVTEPLMTALRTGRIGHAYLFSGPRGCGKTTSARILARCLNCAEGPTDTPCGSCPSCVELSRDGGGSLDVVEIDAASHGGVDDARDLRERAVFAPARDRFKIFIIDEAHMVTPGGFNALLKIVEEPPPHVKFIFATTEPDKVIGTIRSRTHHYPFRLIAPGTLIDYVQSLCDSEGVQVEPGVLPLVVRAGGGSVRDTLSILDQLIAGSEGSVVTAERAAGLLGFTHAELLDDVVVALGSRDAAAAFRATDRVVQTGQDPRRFVEDLLERLRDLIVVSATTVDGAAAVFRGVPQDQLTRMFAQSQSFARGELSRIADTVSSGLDKMAGATAPRLQLELMIARALVASEEHASRAPATGGGAPAPGAGAAAPASPPAAQAPAAPASAPVAPNSAPAPQGPAPDAVAALAAARGAVAEPAAPPQSNASPSGDTPSGDVPSGAATSGASPSSAPNAAQTAASIREFLRDEAAAGPAGPAQPSDPQAAPRPPQQAEPRPAASGPGAAGDTAPHPNEAAASFGRPISDILSSSQIASIGSEASPAVPPRAESVAAEAAAPSSGGPSSGAPGQESGAPATPPAPAAPAAVGGAAAADDPDAAGEGDDPQSQLEDLLELWPDLLEEILERDREAWNAVRPVTPLGLDGDVLTIGLASQSDLAAFKAGGAGPLRETILSAVGISVKYVPKRLPEGGSDTQPQGGAREPQPGSASDAEEPHQAGSPSSDDPVQRAAARLSALGPALAAPAWADPPPAPPSGADAPAPAGDAGDVTDPTSPEPAGDPTGDPAPADPAAAATPDPAPAPDAGAGIGSGVDAGAANGRGPAPVHPGLPDATPADPSIGDYVDPSDDPYGEGDPYAAGDRFPSDPSPADTPALAAESPRASNPTGTAAPFGAAEPASAAEPAGAPAPGAAPVTPGTPAAPGTPGAPDPDRPRAAPAFTRYGEAVVREVLGARFIEERPLPPRLEA